MLWNLSFQLRTNDYLAILHGKLLIINWSSSKLLITNWSNPIQLVDPIGNLARPGPANFASERLRSTAQQNKVLLNKKLTRVIKYKYQGNRGWHWMLWNFGIWISISSFQLRTNDYLAILHGKLLIINWSSSKLLITNWSNPIQLVDPIGNLARPGPANFASERLRSTAQQNKVLLNKKLTRVTKYQYQGNRGWHWMLWNFGMNFDFSVTD